MFPPSLCRLYFRLGSKRAWGLWLPVVLLWPLLLLLSLLLLPVLFLLSMLTLSWIGFRLLGVFYSMLCSLRGTEVDVRTDDVEVRVYVF